MEKQIAALATDEQHMVMWDIDSVLEDFDSIQSVPVSTTKLIPQNWLTIDKEYAITTDLSKPIVLFELPENKAYIADGNHRLYRAASEEIPEMNVMFVPERIHLKYLFRCSVTDYHDVIRGLMREHIFIDSPF